VTLGVGVQALGLWGLPRAQAGSAVDPWQDAAELVVPLSKHI